MPHIHEKYDFCVGFFIVHDDKVLMVNHPRYDMWLAPGGHIELDEDPEEALFREIKEETGLQDVEILSSKPDLDSPGTKFIYTPNYVDVHEANLPHKHIVFIYFAKSATSEFVLSTEHSDIRWLSLEDVDDPVYNLSPAIKLYCKEAIKAYRGVQE